MDNYFYANERPSTLLTSACAPSAAAPITAAPWASLPREHQVQIQAELAQILVPSMGGGSSFRSPSTAAPGGGRPAPTPVSAARAPAPGRGKK